ncbi:MAG: class I SAM-dependent methyltransferase [Alphaproteobacteria bacterium]|nr:class I SAM-dependent methyltransferase [Alphaproteobacteria bacterium]
MSTGSVTTAIRGHYESQGSADQLLADIDDPDLNIGPALDQFHVGGAKATHRLLAEVELPAGSHVLDVGSGLGGPARLLAGSRKWRVTGIDLSPEFCRIATALSVRADMTAQTAFSAGDAVRLPFPDGVFDAVWTEHVAMNIGARDDLYRELARVVRRGGLLAIYDVVAGENTTPLTFPVPWARDAEHSHLVTAEMLRERVSGAGWVARVWNDESIFARDWLANMGAPKAPAGPSLRHVMGDDFPAMTGNLRDNFADGRLGAVQAVFEKNT